MDTETGIQVMEILKEIAKDRLVIMVTHNPDLAEQYSTRIVRMLDGKVLSDSMPVTDEEMAAMTAQLQAQNKDGKKKKAKKPSMSLWTSFGLSLRNLITKKGRTALTSFAGSIGIIGIALIYAVSQGTTNYINLVQEDTLSSYPITLQAQTVSLGSLLSTFAGSAESAAPHENDAVYQKMMLYDLMSAYSQLETKQNDLGTFKTFLEQERQNEDGRLYDTLSGVQYTYNLDLPIYTRSVDGTVIHSDSNELIAASMEAVYGFDVTAYAGSAAASSMSAMSSMSTMSSGSVLWQEMLPGKDGALFSDLLEQQYDVIYGAWPNSYDEVVLIVDENNELSDLSLYALGLTSEEEVLAVLKAAMSGDDAHVVGKSWSYADICNLDFRVILPCDAFVLNEETGTYVDMRDDAIGLGALYENALHLRVSGIIRPSKDAAASMLTGSIAYTSALTEYIVNRSNASAAVTAQQNSPDVDVLNGLIFKDAAASLTESEKVTRFVQYVAGLTDAQKAEIYLDLYTAPSAADIEAAAQKVLSAMTHADMVDAIMSSEEVAAMGLPREMIDGMSDEQLRGFMHDGIYEMKRQELSAAGKSALADKTDAELAAALDALPEILPAYYDKYVPQSDSTYDDNLQTLGYVDLDAPSTINLYATTFADKDVISEVIADYNASVDETQKIEYTDYVKILMSSITTIINAISYVLIGFVSVSLVVSSIMIGVITLISVQERTKEIGILRATGASKKNVSGLFNAETVMIGLFSGLIGCGVTWLLCIPLNLILHHLTDINTLSATLPLPVAGVLVAISVVLTLMAGIIPSRSAAKKDPVIALRTE